MSLRPFIVQSRVTIHADGSPARSVCFSDLAKSGGGNALSDFMADKAPLFYRDPAVIVRTLHDGYFLTAFKEALKRLPTSEHFHNSHFSEILGGLFAQEALGLRLIYSKLTLLTAENANPNKMDLVLYIPESDPVTFVMGEVKSSMKSAVPANHHQSCFPSLFASLRDYDEDDLFYDITAAKDHLAALPDHERDAVRRALLPYARREVLYAGFIVIDAATRHDDETGMLASRNSEKTFDIDLICVEELEGVSQAAFSKLEVLRDNV